MQRGYTQTYTYFGIESNGWISSKGLVGNKNGIFNPNDITDELGIQPFKSWQKGDKRRDGSEYFFSSWGAERSDKDILDVEAQCLDTIKNLRNKISVLQRFKETYDVNYILVVVPSVYGEEKPHIAFKEEIIEFCYLTGTTINFDTYIYPTTIGDRFYDIVHRIKDMINGLNAR
ncbi:DUF4279 domain-containing protein [Metabacillus idriensis]|uniref:DUF4279 domain-containing protein n=1 Tax=Metabacillus idriensis TaxID=324768 RepID=UPI0028132F8E|nr:DUF4279 domain-containing protein [Metabacillus idriensis]MDR0140215.1 DUF4279 domain-containing protein [Metabacillus idriensis]